MKVHYDPCWYITLIAGGNHAFLAIRKSSDFMLRFNTTEGIRCSSHLVPNKVTAARNMPHFFVTPHFYSEIPHAVHLG